MLLVRSAQLLSRAAARPVGRRPLQQAPRRFYGAALSTATPPTAASGGPSRHRAALLFRTGQTGRAASAPFSAAAGGPSAPPSGDDTGTSSPYIVEVDQENFQAIVQGSITTPTILDAYADWCGPCKQLTPLLEQAVVNAGGKMILAKINTDEQQELARMLKISSLPSVFGLFGGTVVDQFVGAKSPADLVPFFDNLLALGASAGDAAQVPAADDDSKEAALARATEMLIATGDLDAAAGSFKAILSRDDVEENELMAALATGGLLQCAMAAGDAAAVQALLDILTDKHAGHMREEPTLGKLVGEGKLFVTAGGAANGGNAEAGRGVEALESQVAVDPKDIEAWHALALVRLGKKDYEGAVDAALKVVRLDKAWNEGAGKKLCLEIFEALGPADPVTQGGRRRLTNLIL